MLAVFSLLLAQQSFPTTAVAGQRAEPSAIFPGIELPAAWRKQFFEGSDAKALLSLDDRQLIDLVPVQAGIRYCGCPECGAQESDEPLLWSMTESKIVKCRRCGKTLPNDNFPAKLRKDSPELPEETIEVVPGVIHRYVYHLVEESKAHYPDERNYLQAKRDYEARKFLARAALYAASEYRAMPEGGEDPKLARVACIILLRFAQVYPRYATHYDQPGQPKYFQPATLQPPYRRGYQTAKWDWSGSLNVPMNLVMAYAIVRGNPVWREVGRLLNDPNPEQTVLNDLFRSSAEFARLQPVEISEEALQVTIGLLAVGRLMNDPDLQAEAMARLETFARRGFYHDGFWREGDIRAHRRIVGILDGWLAGLLDPPASEGRALAAAPPRPARDGALRRAGLNEKSAPGFLSILNLARRAGAIVAPRSANDGVERTSWPGRARKTSVRGPALLGGAGLARLAVGEGDNALDLELRGFDSFGGPHFQRLALRVSAAGEPVIDDLDEVGATTSGWEMATASHNTVVVDGLNQRESLVMAGRPEAGSDILFFAADPDFQVVSMDDPRAYPQSATKYRQTLIATAGARSLYGLSVFEVDGGLQHDQIYHSAPGQGDRWALNHVLEAPPASLLPSSITFLPSTRPDQGRWFVQSYGEFQLKGQARLAEASVAALMANDVRQSRDQAKDRSAADVPNASRVRLRLHVLSDSPTTAYVAESPDPTLVNPETGELIASPWRGSLVLRHQSVAGETLKSVFVTVFEPLGQGLPPLRKVSRIPADENCVGVIVETVDGIEYLLVNRNPGRDCKVALPNGRFVSFNGVALRMRADGIALAGGSLAEGGGRVVNQPVLTGLLTQSERSPSGRGLGWFTTPERLPEDHDLAGRILVVQHADGTCRSWTLDSMELTSEGTRLYVREEPGFSIDPRTNRAEYYQFPHQKPRGPHRFHVARIVRSEEPRQHANASTREIHAEP